MTEGWQEPGWWHHYHANSRNTDRVAAITTRGELEVAWSWPDRDARRDDQPGVSAFNGAVLSKDQGTLYVTSSRRGQPNLHALDVNATGWRSRERWSFPLDAWATWSSALVDVDDTVYVSDRTRTVALEPQPEGGAALRWEVPHEHVSMSHGFTPWGELFEVTITGSVNIYQREADSAHALLAHRELRADWAALPIPLGVGLPIQLQEPSPLRDDAYPKADPRQERRAACRYVSADPLDECRQDFLAPGHIAYLWDEIAEQQLLSDERGLVGRFLDTSFGGVFASNTPAIVQLNDHVARIFIATLGEYHPPARPGVSRPEEVASLRAFQPEDLKRLFAPFDPLVTPTEINATLVPNAWSADGRFAIDPDPETACYAISDDRSDCAAADAAPPFGAGGEGFGSGDEPLAQPYLFPVYGVPDDADTIRGKLDQVDKLDDLEAGEGLTLKQQKVRWRAVADLKNSFRALARGYYSGALQVVDFDHDLAVAGAGDEALTVYEPIPMPSPSGTTAAITPKEARGDGQQLVILAAGSQLFAYRVGEAGVAPRESELLAWSWDAGLSVGGSPTVLMPEDLGLPAGSGAVLAVLAGFRGVSLVQDLSGQAGGAERCSGDEDDCCGTLNTSLGEPVGGAAGACQVVTDINPLPFRTDPVDGVTREQAYFGAELTELAVATSVVEAGRDHFYVAFTRGPAHDELFERLNIGNWEDFIPKSTEFVTVRLADQQITQRIPVAEAPVCDSTLGLDGRVYSIHTSGMNQILHVLYPHIWPTPRGGVVAFE